MSFVAIQDHIGGVSNEIENLVRVAMCDVWPNILGEYIRAD